MMILFFLNLMLAASAAELVKSSPPYTPVCPGDKVVLTCTTNTSLAFWRVSGPNGDKVVLTCTINTGLAFWRVSGPNGDKVVLTCTINTGLAFWRVSGPNGDKVVLTCTTNTGLAFWRVSGPNATIVIVPESGTVFTTLILNITKRNGKTVVSTGTYESINKLLNGTVIGCTGGSVNPEYSNVQHMSQIVTRRR